LKVAGAATLCAAARCMAMASASPASIFTGAARDAALPDLSIGKVMSVAGPLKPSRLGVTLAHEILIRDLSGADAPGAIRYDMEKAFELLLPKLVNLKTAGCQTLVEATPAYMGRNVKFLQRLSRASGLNILTNTGYSAEEGSRYLPASVESEKMEDIAFGWIREAWYGVGESGVRPGVIKLGLESGGLTALQGKLFQAAARTHLQTGLPLLVQSADGLGVAEGLSLLRREGIEAEALIWAGGSEASNRERLEQAKMGIRLCLGAITPESAREYLQLLGQLKKEKLLDRVLLGHGSSHYWVAASGTEKSLRPVGEMERYLWILDGFLPQLQEVGFSRSEVAQITEKNPRDAFEIGVRKAGSRRKKKYLLF
jgi:predicted metal-dependent phosphotriesterase family hydrolase